jgi:cytochrome oxidase Cu insertion factor (SCO1/SenC/PrrC family)
MNSTRRDPQSERSTLGERLFLGVVMLGVFVIGTVTAFIMYRSRQTETVTEARSSALVGTPSNSDETSARHLIDFALTDRTGRTVTRADLEGQFLVVNFVFASCSLSCLQVNHRMAEIQRLIADQPDVRLLSLTVDPQSDTPSALAKFAERFGADTNRWLFLTGDKRSLHSLIEQSFLGPPDPKLAGFAPGGWARTDRIAVADTRGQVRAMFNGTKASAPNEVMEMVKKLRSESLVPHSP